VAHADGLRTLPWEKKRYFHGHTKVILLDKGWADGMRKADFHRICRKKRSLLGAFRAGAITRISGGLQMSTHTLD
jgi:hypothetical protein